MAGELSGEQRARADAGGGKPPPIHEYSGAQNGRSGNGRTRISIAIRQMAGQRNFRRARSLVLASL
jgi:hypothetical protein